MSLLDGRHESEELLDMNDVDVIDLQADGSAVNLSGNNIVSFFQFFFKYSIYYRVIRRGQVVKDDVKLGYDRYS